MYVVVEGSPRLELQYRDWIGLGAQVDIEPVVQISLVHSHFHYEPLFLLFVSHNSPSDTKT